MALWDNPVWLAHLLALVLTGATQAVLAAWIYVRKWERRGAPTFVGMTIAGLAWIVSEIVLVAATDPAIQVIAYLSGKFWTIVASAAFVVFASQYTNAGFHRNRVVRATLVALVVGYLVLVPTNHVHHFLFEPFTPATEPFPYVMYERGPAYSAIVPTLLVLVAYAVYRMGRYLLSTGRRAGRQLALLMAGGLSVAVLEVTSTFGLMPLDNYNYAVYGLLPFNLFTALAVFRFSLLDVGPIARANVVENLRDPVVVLDGDGNLVDYNRASRHVFPDIDGGLGNRLSSVCPELAAHMDQQSVESRADGGVVLPYDGQDRHYSVTVSTVRRDRTDGGAWRAILLRDVTALERSRTQLAVQNERLDQVAETLSHDLRNPIQVAEGHVELVREVIETSDIDDEERETAIEHLETTGRSIERMDAILEDVLSIAREGKTVDETKPVSLADAARDAWRNVETGDATLEVLEDRPFAADRSKLLTIFENLYRNSLDHGGSDVTVTVGWDDDGFYVQDDGAGIPEAAAEDVFEFGYTTRGSGTGIGLSLVRTMAESHGWTVHVDESCGDGARFVFGRVTGPGAEDRDDE